MKTQKNGLHLPSPDLQVDFSACLAAARTAYLIDALSIIVGKLDIRKLDTDFSNIHNRIGEAEKSHQKARQTGYTEVATGAEMKARRERWRLSNRLLERN
jgi:hypothetical protein